MNHENDAAGQFLPPSARHWSIIARLLTACNRNFGRLLGELSELAETELLVLWICHERREQGTAQIELAQASGISTGQVSHLVERLRGLGLLESERSASDRRRRIWRLTGMGRNHLRQAGETMAERLADLNSRIPQEDIARLLELLTRLAAESDAAVAGANASEKEAA